MRNSARIHKGANPWEHGYSLSWWIGLSIKIISLSYIFLGFKHTPPTFIPIEMGINTKEHVQHRQP